MVKPVVNLYILIPIFLTSIVAPIKLSITTNLIILQNKLDCRTQDCLKVNYYKVDFSQKNLIGETKPIRTTY